MQNIFKIDEKDFFETFHAFHKMNEKTNEEVEQSIINEFGILNVSLKINEEKKYSFKNKKMTIKEIKKFLIKKRLNNFWDKFDFEFRLSFLVFFCTSSLRCINIGSVLHTHKFIDEKEIINDALNTFYILMKLIHEGKETIGYEIYMQLVKTRIYDENIKYINQNNNMIINPALSLSENQKILKQKYKQLQIIKLYNVNSIKKLEYRLVKYVISFLLIKYEYTYSEIVDEFNAMMYSGEVEQTFKKDVSRTIKKITDTFN